MEFSGNQKLEDCESSLFSPVLWLELRSFARSNRKNQMSMQLCFKRMKQTERESKRQGEDGDPRTFVVDTHFKLTEFSFPSLSLSLLKNCSLAFTKTLVVFDVSLFITQVRE